MAVGKSYARLGFFIVVGLIVMLATALMFIQRMRSRAVLEMVTYTRENVSGLDISSPVRLLGVPVGRVSDIRVDPVGNTIEVDFEVFRDRLVEIGANAPPMKGSAQQAYPGMRVQVIGNPVTGEAYLLLNIPSNPPPPIELGFTPTRSYLPWMPSPLTALRDRVPEVLDRAEATMQTIREIVTRIPGTLDRSNEFFTSVERIFRESRLPELSADSRTFFATTSAQIAQVTADMDRLTGTGGSLDTLAKATSAAVSDADLPGSTKSARDALDKMSLAADDLRRSLPAIRESLEQLRELARRLEEQPESVVYGPRPPKVKKR